MRLPRVVHVSTGAGFSSRSSKSSSAPSACSNGFSNRQDIASRVEIAVMLGSALRAGPWTHAQRQCVQSIPTDRAQLTTRKEAVDLHHRLRFGFQHADSSTDRGIRQGTGQAVVLGQVSERQIFHIDRIEPSRQHGAQLVQAVAPGVGDLLMQTGHAAGLFAPPVRPLLLPRQAPLRTGEQEGLPPQVSGVRNGLTVREGGETREAEVDPDRLAGLDPRDGWHLQHHRDVVAPGWVARPARAVRAGA